MEAAVSASQGVMRFLPGMLGSLLTSDYGHALPKEVRTMIGLLRGEIEALNTLILEPSVVEHPKSTAQSWMKEVRDLSYDVHDFLDSLAAKTPSSAASGYLPGKITRLHQDNVRSRRITTDISRFRARVKEAIDRHKNYGLGSRSSLRQYPSDGHRQLPLEAEGASSRLVGIESSVEKIGEWLTDGDKLTRVVSIVGPGGVGKTTLARKLYNDTGGQFDCRAFVQTSRRYDTITVLKSMVSQLQLQEPLHETWDDKGLIREIKRHLQGKRYSF
uniref:Rx N-terminal domain-containing protein n=1 Tax=Oryza glumipatula TaxID=40148 RepID=A0A0E0AUZ8_9ORYZ